MKNKTLKTIIKHLANAPRHAAREALKECTTEEEKAEALRIFRALDITPADDNDGGAEK